MIVRMKLALPLLPLAGALASVACSSAPPSAAEKVGSVGAAVSGSPEFYTPGPSDGAQQQIAALTSAGQKANAQLVETILDTPQAVWFTGGTPKDVSDGVHKVVARAQNQGTPILVAYNIPFRDCAQYSAGGAVDTAAYEAWIDGFAAGLGSSNAVVILEPDSLGIIPYYTSFFNSSPDWCQPTVNGQPAPGANPTERFAQLNHAIQSIHAQAPNARVYLDATHAAWLGANEAANRLAQAGVASAAGFYVNVSNYQPTVQSITYGTWISDCLALMQGQAAGNIPSWWQPSWGCPNQYAPNSSGVYVPDYATTAPDPITGSSTPNVQAVNQGYAGWFALSPTPIVPTTHFVIDTSRNGQGALDASSYAAAPFNQPSGVISALNAGNWCNPPIAGLGLLPTRGVSGALSAAGLSPLPGANLGLLDAFLWVKTPGQSDGQCDSAGGARGWDYSQYNPWGVAASAQSGFDPLWGMVDPAAGVWFPAQALALAQNANPPLQ
jgi:endoglucanase